jgi:hypothetical protein
MPPFSELFWCMSPSFEVSGFVNDWCYFVYMP